MPSKQQFCNSLFRTISATATIALALAIVFVVATTLSRSAQAQTFKVIYNFTGGADGSYPPGDLTIDRAGNIYGITDGSTFRLSPKGPDWMFGLLYKSPTGDLTVGPEGALYAPVWEENKIVKLAPAPTACKTAPCTWIETVLYQFQDGNDGVGPSGYPIFDKAGNIYGTNFYGGSKNCPNGCGTIYKLTPSNGGWTESVLYRFTGGSDGASPNGVIFDTAGNLYGATYYGGFSGCGYQGSGCGTVYQLTPSGSGWTKNTLYIFQDGNDGGYPNTGLMFDQAGNLYGATGESGVGGGGTIFELSPSNGTWTFSTPYVFNGHGPASGLNVDAAGNLYGTTGFGGSGSCPYGCGTVFKLTPGSGGWTYTDLHDFNGSDGFIPEGKMVLDANGNLYGTTYYGGTGACYDGNHGCGTVFELTQ